MIIAAVMTAVIHLINPVKAVKPAKRVRPARPVKPARRDQRRKWCWPEFKLKISKYSNRILAVTNNSITIHNVHLSIISHL